MCSSLLYSVLQKQSIFVLLLGHGEFIPLQQ